MNHKQALSDYMALNNLSGGGPYDSGADYEQIAEKLLARPTAKEAADHLCDLIRLYYVRGNVNGESMLDDPTAKAIFVRHHLIESDEE